MDDSAIIDLFFERSEQALTELERKYGPAQSAWRSTSWGTAGTRRNA